MVKHKEDRDHLVTFTGLNGGQVYMVQAVTVSGEEVSDPVTKSILTGKWNNGSFTDFFFSSHYRKLTVFLTDSCDNWDWQSVLPAAVHWA